MSKIKKIICLLIVICLVVSAVACGKRPGGKIEFSYPDYQLSNTESESWEQWRAYDDEIIEIDWYADIAGYSWPGNNVSKISKIIQEKTGIKINFMSPLNADAQMLNSLIAADMLPDLVTILGNSSERVQLCQDGYIYPLNEVAERWAPKMMDRIDDEIKEYFDLGDERVYGLSQGFYLDKDIEVHQEMGQRLISNGAIVARKDYLDAYCAYKKKQNSEWKDTEATTPSGFIEMCKWVKQEYELPNTNPTVLFSAFDTTSSTTGSKGLNWLMEYFCVPPEDEEGNLTYQYAEEGFKEIVTFLNDLYTENLLVSSNLSATESAIGSYIQQGLPFVCILSPQDYAGNYSEWLYNNPDKEYVPIVLTNENGDAPLLRDAAGKGYRYTMMSSNCSRPDRVIRLLDYLWSIEGQTLLWFGVEGEHFNYEVEPGETVTEEVVQADGSIVNKTLTYPYGKMVFTDDYMSQIKTRTLNTQTEGMYGSFILLLDPMFCYVACENHRWVFNYNQYVHYNQKAPLFDFTYNYKYMQYPYDSSDAIKLAEMISVKKKLEQLWVQYMPRMISAKNNDEALSIYETTLKAAKRYGYEDMLEWNNNAFLAYKQEKGYEFGWPKNDPDSDYQNIKVTSLYGNRDYAVEIPGDVNWR